MDRHSTQSSLVSEGPPRHTPTPDDYPEELLPVLRKLLAVVRNINRVDDDEVDRNERCDSERGRNRRQKKKKKKSDDGDNCGCCGILWFALLITAIVFLARATMGEYDGTFDLAEHPDGTTKSAETLLDYVGVGFLVQEPDAISEDCLESFRKECNVTVVNEENSLDFLSCSSSITQGSVVNSAVSEECQREFVGAITQLNSALQQPAIVSPMARIDAFHQCEGDAKKLCGNVVDNLASPVRESDEDSMWYEQFDEIVNPFDPKHVFSLGSCLLENRGDIQSDDCARVIDLFQPELALEEDDFMNMFRAHSFMWYDLPQIPNRLVGWLGGAAISVVWGGILLTLLGLCCCTCCCAGCICKGMCESGQDKKIEEGCEKCFKWIMEYEERERMQHDAQGTVDLENPNDKNDYVVAVPADR